MLLPVCMHTFVNMDIPYLFDIGNKALYIYVKTPDSRLPGGHEICLAWDQAPTISKISNGKCNL